MECHAQGDERPERAELWKMAAFLELCPKDIMDQIFLRIDEIKENYAVLREKVLGWGGEQGGTGEIVGDCAHKYRRSG